MLILKICSNDVSEPKKRFLRARRQKNINIVERQNIKLSNDIYTYMKIDSWFQNNEDLSKLLNIYKGKILFCDRKMTDEICVAYGFDYRPYYRRAILSTLNRMIVSEGNKFISLCLCSEKIDLNKETTELVKNVRQLTIVTDESVYTQEFFDYCFYNFGSVVNFTTENVEQEYDMYIDLDKIDESCKVVLIMRGREMILYPDATYFSENKDVGILTSLGIPTKVACSALEIKPYEPLSWVKHN